VQLDPKLPFAHYLYGLLLLDTDDYKRAIPELETAKKGITDDPKLYFALGTAYARAGRTADAERARAQFQLLQKGAANQ
jgi:predicted Zn-dependent protease